MTPRTPDAMPARLTDASHDGNSSSNSNDSDEARLRALARRRVGRKLGFYVHAAVFVLVNLGLFALDALDGGMRWQRFPAHFPLLGWGLGLAIHGIVTLVSLQGDGLRDRMVEAEVTRLRARR